MAANMLCTRLRLSATACGFARSLSSQTVACGCIICGNDYRVRAAMSEIIWINGQVMPMSQAHISVEDRGFQFADGVYEVIRIYNGKTFTLAEHLQRLKNSCEGIRLALPMEMNSLANEIEKFAPQTKIASGMIYLQITRGVAERNHLFGQIH